MDRLSEYTARESVIQKAQKQLDLVRFKLLGMPIEEAHMKAAVTAAGLSGFPDARSTTDAILKLAEPRRLLAQLGGIPSEPNTVVYDIPMDPAGGFVPENEPIPMIAISGASVRTGIGKIAAIYGLDEGLVRATEGRMRSVFDQTITRLIWLLENRELLSSTAAVPNGRPAGLLASAPDFGGGSPGDLETAIADMFAYVTDGQAVRPFFIMSPRAALWAALQRTETGARFPHVKITGGDIAGIPLLVSAAAGNKLILIDAGKLLVVDEGVQIEGSRQAAVQMSDTPSVGATNVVAAFQTNTMLVKIQRYVHWTLVTDDAVAYTEIPELAGSPD